MATDFILPELGEDIASGDVLRLLVKPGDVLAKDQTVLELETDKATIEVPSSVAGRITDVKVKAGDKVKVGQAILSVEAAGASPAAAPPTPAAAAPAPAAAPPPAPAPPFAAAIPGAASRAPESRDDESEEAPAPRPKRAEVVDISRGARPAPDVPSSPELAPAPAAPSVRRLARELGVEISRVEGTGAAGRISPEDVKAHAKQLVSAALGTSGVSAGPPLPDFSRWGEIERQPMRAVRRKTAEHLSAAWATIPHVTQHDRADITALEEARKRPHKQAGAADANITMTAIALKVVAGALKRFPQFNASIDLAAGEIILKKYINVGVAVDTDRGLLVPVVRDVDTKNILQLSVETAQLAEKARARKMTLEDMQGGCFTVTNLGGIGGTSFTPIVNLPEVAILGISRAAIQPAYKDGGFVPRLMLPLSLAYDHRVIDGADGARFLRWIVEALEQPFLLALEG